MASIVDEYEITESDTFELEVIPVEQSAQDEDNESNE